MVKTAILFLTEGFEEAEALVTVDILRRGGVQLTVASLTSDKRVVGSHDIVVEADCVFDGATENKNFDATILPGGPGTKNYYEHERLLGFLKKRADDKTALIAAICAAPGVLGRLGLLRGKRATCYTGHEDKLEGAVFTGNASETDGNIITGRSAGKVFDFALEVLGYLCGDEESERVRSAVIYERGSTGFEFIS